MYEIIQRRWGVVILLLSLSVFTLSAQSGPSLSGLVIDKDGQPLVGCNIRLLDGKAQMIAGTNTDANGHFSLKTQPVGKYKLVASYVGYKSHERDVTLPHKGQPITIKMVEDTQMLSTVVVAARGNEMTVKGDTLVFHADAFRPGEGAILEALVKRLPGAIVDEEGNISINGKQVKKITVDGKDFFAGDPKTATKNLPAEAIERLELLDRQSEASRMTGFNDGDEETVLNLSFKASHKKGFFGQTFAGYGLGNRYDLAANLNNFKDNNRQTLILGLNNNNNRSMSEFKVEGIGSRRRGFGQNEGVTTSAIAAGDMAVNFRNWGAMESNAQYNYANQFVQRSNATQIFRPDGDFFSHGQEEFETKGHTASFRGRFTFSPTKTTEIVATPRLTYSTNRNLSKSDNHIKEEADRLLNEAKTMAIGRDYNLLLGGQLIASQCLSKDGRVLTLSARAEYATNHEQYTYDSWLSTPITGDEEQQLYRKEDDDKLLRLGANLSWVEALGLGYAIQSLIGYERDQRLGMRDVYMPDAGGGLTQLDDQYASRLRNSLDTYTANLNLQKKGEKYSLTVGILYEPTHMHSALLAKNGTAVQKLFHRWSPSIRFEYKSSKQTSIRFFYRGRSTMPAFRLMVPVADPTDIQRIVIGNTSLAPSYTHRLRGGIRSYNPASRLAYNLFFFGNYTLDDIASKVTFDTTTGKQTITYVNVDGNIFLGLFGSVTAPLFHPSLSINTGIRSRYNRTKGFIEGHDNLNQNLILTPFAALSWAKGPVYLRVHGSISLNHSANSTGLHPHRNAWDYTTTVEGSYDILPGLKLESDFSYLTNKGYATDFDRNDLLFNAALSYGFLKDKVVTVRLKGYDLLGSETGIRRAVNNLQISDTRTNVIGRTVMLHFIYRFNSFRGGASADDMPERRTRRFH